MGSITQEIYKEKEINLYYVIMYSELQNSILITYNYLINQVLVVLQD